MTNFNENDFRKYTDFIVTEIEDGVFHLQLNNPKTLNAFKENTWRAYGDILEKLDAIKGSKVILISSGVPKAFSSGLDLKEAMKTMQQVAHSTEEEKYEHLKKHIEDFQRSIGTPARINTPTICVMNGICFGLAMDIASSCSIRIATLDARFSIREIKIGIPADIGSLQRLPALLNNISLFYQYSLTGSIFGAEEALKLGLISKVLPDLTSAVKHGKELATEISQHVSFAIKGTKEHVQQMIDGLTVEDGLRSIKEFNAKNINQNFVNSMSKVKL